MKHPTHLKSGNFQATARLLQFFYLLYPRKTNFVASFLDSILGFIKVRLVSIHP